MAFEPGGWPSGLCDPEPQGVPEALLRELGSEASRGPWVAPSPGLHCLGQSSPIWSTW